MIKNNKIKILISPLMIFTMLHTDWGIMVYFQIIMNGSNIFMNLSIKTNYDWYIKTHPDLVGKLGVYQRKSR